MQSKSPARSVSSPSILRRPGTERQTRADGSALPAAHAAVLNELALWRGGEEFTRDDDLLWQTLLHHVDHADGVLDLSECGATLHRAPASLMRALAAHLASRTPPLTGLLLPACLCAVPAWTRYFTQLETVSLPRFRGAKADLSMLPALERVGLDRVAWPTLKLLVPGPSVVVDHEAEPDLRVQTGTTSQGAFRLKFRWYSFNHSTTIDGSSVDIECRHIALKTLEHWNTLDWARVPVDRMDPASFAWIESEAQLGASVSLQTDEICRKLAFRPSNAFVVGFESWPAFMNWQSQRLRERGSPAFAMLNTTTHAIPVVFAFASDRNLMVVALDPNFSRTPRLCGAGDGIAGLFERFDECRGKYFARSGEEADAAAFVKITFIDDPSRPGRCAVNGPASVNCRFADLPTSWHAELVREFIVTGSAEGLQMLATHIEAGMPLPPDVLRALVQGRERIIGVPWMHKAAQAGHAPVMAAWGSCLVAAFERHLIAAPDLLDALLMQQGSSTLLSCALKASHSGFVRCFGDVVLELFRLKALKSSDVYRLLSLNGRADGAFERLVASRKVARALRQLWSSLHREGALSEVGYANLKDWLKQVSWRKRMV